MTARFNSHGLNDDETDYSRKEGLSRVLLLGDSVAEATQVQRSDNFGERLERKLRENGEPVEIVNAGHSGFGTDNELLYFEYEGHRYQPDVVLLALNLQNDIAENSPTIVQRMYRGGAAHPKAGVAIDAAGSLQIDPTPYEKALIAWESDSWRSRPVLAWLRRNSFFVRHLSNLLRADTRPRAPSWPATYPAELEVYAAPPTGDWLEARRLTAAMLFRLREIVEQHGSKLLVVVSVKWWKSPMVINRSVAIG